jgi:hypothetical protein
VTAGRFRFSAWRYRGWKNRHRAIFTIQAAQEEAGRSFAAQAGNLSVRIVITLVASFHGPRPHLQSNARCGTYAKRPRVCRIYPAAVNPFIRLTPNSKVCREVDAKDAGAKERPCMSLAISTAALANEGFVIHSPRREVAMDALYASRQPMFAGIRRLLSYATACRHLAQPLTQLFKQPRAAWPRVP